MASSLRQKSVSIVRLIDGKSGMRVRVGETIVYENGESWWRLLGIRHRLLTASVFFEGGDDSGCVSRRWIELPIRPACLGSSSELTTIFPSPSAPWRPPYSLACVPHQCVAQPQPIFCTLCGECRASSRRRHSAATSTS